MLESLLRQGATNAVVASIWDADAVEACIAAGVGNEVSLNIGGKLDTRHSQPLPVTGIVRLISDGDYYWGGVRAPERLAQRGPIVVLTVDGVDVILTAERQSYVEPAQFHSLGIEPLAYKIVVPKRGYLTTPLHVISPRSILAVSPGVTNCDVRQLEYRRVQIGRCIRWMSFRLVMYRSTCLSVVHDDLQRRKMMNHSFLVTFLSTSQESEYLTTGALSFILNHSHIAGEHWFTVVPDQLSYRPV